MPPSTLLAIRGPLTGTRLVLQEPRTILGRSTSCTIALTDNAVSRQHASLTRQRAAWLLEDLGSSSGTFLNGKPLHGVTALSPDDEIRIGHSIFLFDSEFDLQNADFTDNSVYFSSPNDETMELAPVATLDAPAVAPEEEARLRSAGFLESLGELFEPSRIPFGDALRHSTERLSQLIQSDTAVLLLYDSALQRLRVAAAVPEASEPLLDGSVIRKVYHERRALLLSDKPELARHPAPNAPNSPTVRSVVAAPLLVEDSCLGLIYFERRELDAYTLRDLRLAQSLGRLMAVFIEMRQRAEATSLRDRMSEAEEGRVIGGSMRFRKMVELVRRAAPTPIAVLLLGETGSGKEVIARELHRLSPRGAAGKPFVAVNCAAIPESLFEGEFFGHERGAFTGAHRTRPGLVEQANGGTLFLDEIGELSLAMQPKLLRFLQEGAYMRVGGTRLHQANVRLIAATNRSLLEEVRRENFREDLFHRLSVMPIEVPPLRERREDIRLLAEYFCKRFSDQMNRRIVGISDEALIQLEKYDWPGNVRELANCVERAVLLCDGRILLPRHFVMQPLIRHSPPSPRETPPPRDKGEADLRPLADVEREHILRVLHHVAGNQVKASGMLGIHRNTLRKKLADWS